MQVKIWIAQEQANENKIDLFFQVNINKHNRANSIGTISSEVCEGLQLLKDCRSKSAIKANRPINVRLEMGDIALDTNALQTFKQVEILKALRADLKVSVGNANSELRFFTTLKMMFDYMCRQICECTWDEFVAGKQTEAYLQKLDRDEKKALSEAN